MSNKDTECCVLLRRGMELKTSKELTMGRIALLLPALAALSLVAVYAAPAKADTMAKPVTKHHHHHHHHQKPMTKPAMEKQG